MGSGLYALMEMGECALLRRKNKDCMTLML